MPERPPELEKELEKTAQQFEEEQVLLTPEDLLEDSSRENISRYLDQRIENVIQGIATREAMLLKLKEPAERDKIAEKIGKVLSEKVSPRVKESRREELKRLMEQTVKVRLEGLKKGVMGASPENLEKGVEKMIEREIQVYRKERKAA